ncbi:cap binding protein [Zopfia rhizophila CBS 207.26]|uniref:Cap binding protein n=1 Tax=Zopfia rhizophila CBS 207.26 TaxID=1314779 RepID=A0A6A6DUC4_9PEZI|nr:cap binding protein [Zopfia rhizophila CBS 207.26]
MTDADFRREDRRDRGGRNRGHHNNRKRRHQVGTDEDDYDGPRKHHRPYVEPTIAKLRRELLSIADSAVKLPEDEARDIARLLGDNFEEDELSTEFFNTFIQLVVEQPFKIPFAAAIIFYANDSKPEVATEALNRTAERMQQVLNAGQWKEFKLLLRFFACLQSLFEGDGVFTILQQLFDSAVDLQSANENDVVGLELVKIILLTLPYAMVSGGSRLQAQVSELLQKTDIVASMRLPIESLVQSYSGHSEEKPPPYHSVIGLLQEQLQDEEKTGWKFSCIPRFSRPVPRNLDGETLPSAPTMHPFPTITIPSPVNPGPKPLFPEAYFSLYADQEVESVPGTNNIASLLFRDAIVDTIDQLDFNRTAVGKFLIDLDCYWQTETFVKRGTAFDKLRDVADKSTWKPEDVVVDAVFSQIFKLPNPEHKLVYYHSLITETCKIAPAAIAPSLGRAIRFVFKYVDDMDLELVNRFVDWFSHHLSNFEFRWKWAEWMDDLNRSDLHPKKAFLITALDKEIRLSFAKRIRSTLPEEYHVLISEGKDKDKPDFKYDDDATPFAAEGKTLFTQIRKKAPDADIQETINTIHTKAAEQGIGDVLVPSTDALVTSICCVGSKSLSHVLSCINHSKDRLLSISQNSEAARRQIVASVVGYWKDQPGVAVNIVDKLLNFSILAPITVVQWALCDHLGAGEALTEGWVFEMVSNTVTKVTNRMRQIALARLQKGIQQEQIIMVEETLTKERESMRELFNVIKDSVKAVAEGAADTLIEKSGSGELSAEDAELIRAWGKRWYTVFVRKAQVEESVVGEEAVEARLRLLSAEAEPAAEPMHEGNGVAAEAANGDDEML